MTKQWMLLWRGRCRCYFNTTEEFPKIWAIDDGDSANEYKVVDIHILIPGFRTNIRLENMPAQPKVWFDHPSCAVYMNDDNEVQITWK